MQLHRWGFVTKTYSFSFHWLIFGEGCRDRCGMRALRKTLKADPRIFNMMGPDKAAATAERKDKHSSDTQIVR